ncbi:MAG: SDR family oxidoreductase [Pseudorhodoplanes sp.]
MSDSQEPAALIVGASRGLGLGLVQQLIGRGWRVLATVRDPSRQTPLHAVAARGGGRAEIEHVDINRCEDIAALKARLAGRSFDLLFVNAGVSNGKFETVRDSDPSEFTRLLVTNALSPMTVVDAFCESVRPDGVIGVMSSLLGSIEANAAGGYEFYRASKAALNMMMKSFAVSHGEAPWSFVSISPGWVRTDMGGSAAPLDVETSMGGVAAVLESRRGTRGFAFLNYRGETVPW